MVSNGAGDEPLIEGIEVGANIVDAAGSPTPVGVQFVRIPMLKKRKMTLRKKFLIKMRLFLR